MELLSVIRRWHYPDHFSIREISRRTSLSRNTVRKYLRSQRRTKVQYLGSAEQAYPDKPSLVLRQEAGKSRKQKRTIKQLYTDLVMRGCEVRTIAHIGRRFEKSNGKSLEPAKLPYPS